MGANAGKMVVAKIIGAHDKFYATKRNHATRNAVANGSKIVLHEASLDAKFIMVLGKGRPYSEDRPLDDKTPDGFYFYNLSVLPKVA